MSHAFASLWWPSHDFDRPHHLFTLPIVRLVFQGGSLAVPIFFVMSGYLCSLKPLKLARAGKAEEVRTAVTKSAFRRLFRLMGPATFATVVSWILDRLGAYNIARSIPGNRFSLPVPPDFRGSLKELITSFVITYPSH
jgi:peptidoglycan/LPS O-acetylase OafA/YrhL